MKYLLSDAFLILAILTALVGYYGSDEVASIVYAIAVVLLVVAGVTGVAAWLL